MFSFEITWKLNSYDRAPEVIRQQLMGAEGPLRDGLRQAGVVYLDYLQKRFSRLARGGGEWPPLARQTLLRRAQKNRRKGIATHSSLILIDTQTIYQSLTPIWNSAAPGQITRNIEHGVEVGIGGPAKHPDARSMSIGQLAYIQHHGTNVIPSRKIVVAPDAATLDSMQDAIAQGLRQTLRNL